VRYKKDVQGWLKLKIEEPINPEIPICDPHHHLWDGPGNRGAYLLDDYLADASGGHNITKTIFIECGTKYKKNGAELFRPVGETQFAGKQAEQSTSQGTGYPSVAEGIVAFVDFSFGYDVELAIEVHAEASVNRLKGVRQICIWDSDPAVTTMGNLKGMMLDSKFREGFSCLRNYGLVFDAWQYYTQLLELKDLAEKFSDTVIVVNHTGGPLGVGHYSGKREKVFIDWKTNIAELSKCPNVYMKLGGLGMPRCGFGWHEMPEPPTSEELAAAMAPYFDFCIEKFGVDRCMFESNFPIDKVSYSYTVLWNAFKRVSKDFSSHEIASLFYNNAVRVYGLSEEISN
jgi:L-fuconolactonase